MAVVEQDPRLVFLVFQEVPAVELLSRRLLVEQVQLDKVLLAAVMRQDYTVPVVAAQAELVILAVMVPQIMELLVD